MDRLKHATAASLTSIFARKRPSALARRLRSGDTLIFSTCSIARTFRLAIEQVEKINVSPDLKRLAKAEGLLRAKIDVKEAAVACFNLSILNHKSTALTIHRQLCATGR